VSLKIHPASEKRIEALRQQLPQSVLLSGGIGVGLMTIARSIAGQYLIHTIAPTDKDGELDALHGTISVDSIRELYDLTRSKSLARRIVIIDDADMMSPSAQASFLKLLEEPSPHTHFLLTSHHPQQLASTVLSRVQTTYIHDTTHEQTEAILDEAKITDSKRRSQLSFIAAGKPAEVYRLLHDETYFLAKAAIMSDARDLLTKKTYEKLLIIHTYQSDRRASLQLIDSAIALARRNVSLHAQSQLVIQLEKLVELRDQLMSNANPKLQMTRFVL
jgi:DNA polymerase III delta prime subunit